MKRRLIIYIGISALFLALSIGVRAQVTPDFFVTWRSGAYAESGYAGKILAVPGAPVTVSFELIDGGKLVDLSKLTVRWIKNGRLLQSGVGLKTVTIPTNPLMDRDELRLKIVVSAYRGADIDRNVIIPFVAPEVVIRAPYPANTLPIGTQTLRALFYYWNISHPGNLEASWILQNERLTTSGDSSAVTLNIPKNAAGGTLTLSVSAKNTIQEFESARDSRTLFITP